jgi:hypothetical protein
MIPATFEEVMEQQRVTLRRRLAEKIFTDYLLDAKQWPFPEDASEWNCRIDNCFVVADHFITRAKDWDSK